MTTPLSSHAHRGDAQCAEDRREALAGRLLEAAIGTMDLFSIYLGDQLGLYRALAAAGPSTPAELARSTGTHERYIREWLEQQAVTGFLEVEPAPKHAVERSYRLPSEYATLLVERDCPEYLAGWLRLAVGITRPIAAVLEAYRSGHGVAYAAFGPDTCEGIAEANRPMFLHQLGSRWLPSIPDVHARLLSDPPARVADFGCGFGWSSIAIAQAYPRARVTGLDLDSASIAHARQNAEATGMVDRVRFEVRDATDPGLHGPFDLVTAFETLHDMARPGEALRAMRALLAEGGSVLLAEERVAETFAAPGDDLERLNYGFSVLHCLPASMAEQPSAAIGTVMRPRVVRRLAAEAGFTHTELLPIPNDFWSFYRLLP